MKSSAIIAAVLMAVVTIASALAPIALESSSTTLDHTVPGEEDQHGLVPPPPPVPGVGEDLALSHLAPSFTENAGQLENDGILYYASSGEVQVGFGTGCVQVTLRSRDQAGGVAVRLTFPGSDAVPPVARGELGHRSNFFLGNDAGEWRTGVRTYSEVVYEDLYDGIDLVYRAGPEGLKYDLVVRPGADPRLIEMSYEGIEGLELGSDGSMSIRTGIGDLGDAPPTATTMDGRPVPCAYELRGPLAYGFRCGAWDPAQTFVIDPMVYATYIGGSEHEEVMAIAVDASGDAYVTGVTNSTDFPVTSGAFQTTLGTREDAFVAKLNPDGSALVYATYIGGSALDEAGAICVDASGDVFIAGRAYSDDFPVTSGAYQTTKVGSSFFVAKLNPSGSALLYATFLGSGTYEATYALLSVDASGSAYLVGATYADDFPTTEGAYKTTYGGDAADAFVSKLDAAGTALVYSTYIGGSSTDRAEAIAVDANGRAYVVGSTNSTDFPTTAGAYQTTMAGGDRDAFVTVVNAGGSALVYSTYIGGSEDEHADAVTVDALGYAHLAGSTNSTDFPVTAGALQTANNGLYDAFAAKLNMAGTALVYSTYVGGSDNDQLYGLAVDGYGSAHLTGHTRSSDFPVTADALQPALDGGADAFVAKLGPSGTAIDYATYLGGTGFEVGCAIALDSSGNILVGGYTYSTDFPVTSGAFATSYGGGAFDAFVAQVTTVAPPTQYRVDFVTSPPGLDLLIDYVSRTAPYFEMWEGGSFHTVSVTSPQQAGSDTRYSFVDWSDGGYQTHTITADGPMTLTANFVAQYVTTFDTSPTGLMVYVDGTNRATPYSDWWDDGSTHEISVPSPQTPYSDSIYTFGAWSDNGAQTHTIVVDGVETVTATFTVQHRVSIGTDPWGLDVTIDGEVTDTPYSGWWASGSTHTVSTPSPQESGSETRYDFTSWSDDGAMTHSVVADDQISLTAYFTVQYLVTIESDPTGLNASVDGVDRKTPFTDWWASGEVHTISAPSPQLSGSDARYTFSRWSDYHAQAHDVSIGSPETYTVIYTSQYLVEVMTNPPGIGVRVDGEWWTGPASLWLAGGSYHSIYVNYTQDELYFDSWSDGGSISHSYYVTGPGNVTATFKAPPPTLNVVTPTGDQIVDEELRISGSATAFATVWLSVDGGEWTEVTTAEAGGEWTYKWDTTDVPNGNHTLELKAVRSGQESPVTSVRVLVANGGPSGEDGGLLTVYLLNAVVMLFVVLVLLTLLRPGRQRQS